MLVVDDTDLVRRALIRQLARAGYAVVGEAATVAAGLTLAVALAPAVVVLDFHLPNGLGRDAAARLIGDPAWAAARARPPAVVPCTGDPGAAYAAGAAAVSPSPGSWSSQPPSVHEVLARPERTRVVASSRDAARPLPRTTRPRTLRA